MHNFPTKTGGGGALFPNYEEATKIKDFFFPWQRQREMEVHSRRQIWALTVHGETQGRQWEEEGNLAIGFYKVYHSSMHCGVLATPSLQKITRLFSRRRTISVSSDCLYGLYSLFLFMTKSTLQLPSAADKILGLFWSAVGSSLIASLSK